MTLDPKALETATQAMIDAGDFYYSPDTSEVETAITAYLKATDSVIVPREATEEMIAIVSEQKNVVEDVGPGISGCWYCGFSSLRSIYRAMIQAAEGK